MGIVRVGVACLGLAVLPLFAAEPPEPGARTGKIVVTAEARAVHAEALVIDGHNDLPWELRRKADTAFRDFDLARAQPKLHTDIPRLRQGGVGVQFWSAWVPVDTAKKNTAVRTTVV